MQERERQCAPLQEAYRVGEPDDDLVRRTGRCSNPRRRQRRARAATRFSDRLYLHVAKDIGEPLEIACVGRVDDTASKRCRSHHDGVDDTGPDKTHGDPGKPRDVSARRLDDECAKDLRALLLSLASPPPFRDDDARHDDGDPFEQRGLVYTSNVRTSPLEPDERACVERELEVHAAVRFTLGFVFCVVQEAITFRRSSGVGHPSGP